MYLEQRLQVEQLRGTTKPDGFPKATSLDVVILAFYWHNQVPTWQGWFRHANRAIDLPRDATYPDLKNWWQDLHYLVNGVHGDVKEFKPCYTTGCDLMRAQTIAMERASRKVPKLPRVPDWKSTLILAGVIYLLWRN